jgi:PAT family beta-lactamase induction signal transducer AmpG
VSNLGYCWLDIVGKNLFWLGAVNGFENFASGLGNTIFVVFLSRLCSPAYTATQYALLSALAALARTYLAAPGGFLVEEIGWFNFFVVSALSALPGLALVWYLWRSPFGAAVRESELRNRA